MAALSFRIRGEVYRSKDVAKILGYVNNAMYDLLSEEGYFATIILGKYWPLKGSMHLVNAGHRTVKDFYNRRWSIIPVSILYPFWMIYREIIQECRKRGN